MSKTITVRLSKEDKELIENYARFNNLSVSELVRNSVLEKIQDDFDIELAREALAEYEADPVTYSHEEAWEIILDDEEI